MEFAVRFSEGKRREKKVRKIKNIIWYCFRMIKGIITFKSMN